MRYAPLILTLLALSACSDTRLPGWMGGDPPKIERLPGERYDVLATETTLKPDESVLDKPVDVPEQQANEDWRNINQVMSVAHPGITGLENSSSATIGDGDDFKQGMAPSPIVAEGTVYAMDAIGNVSAHAADDIDTIRWVSEAAAEEDEPEILGGGIAYDNGTIYVTTGFGKLVALNAKSGKSIWKTSVGAPVRGAPAISENIAVVLTADNQTLAFNATTGAPLWEHRGIRETAGFFSRTSPVISEGVVVSAYSSGELVALRLTAGTVIWADSVSSPIKTRAAAAFSGIDADPLVQDGVVYVVSAGGVMMANALLNGRPLWSQRIAAHQTPWAAGNALFLLTDEHEVAALFKRDGGVRWVSSLKQTDRGHDITPKLFGPMLAGNAIIVVDADGSFVALSPRTGKKLRILDVPDGIAAAPIVANGVLYLVTADATLHAFK
ncbi:MAG: PQQ-binding-like beta-propeller repeat protein [Alphaproteobacteria bacterium]|nr:PQQ-binding-like beta-propeller repeat protein [Alphaproteobacteria bacterium]